jgi:hypothetical protein
MIAISTGNYKFLPKNCHEMIWIEFYKWAFHPQASNKEKFQLTFLNMTNNWCTKVFTAVVSWGLTRQGRMLGFTALRGSYKKERTTDARKLHCLKKKKKTCQYGTQDPLLVGLGRLKIFRYTLSTKLVQMCHSAGDKLGFFWAGGH